MDELSGRTALVTGGASGIGLGIARALARAGTTVVIADVDHDAVRSAEDSLDSQRVAGIPFDVTDRRAWADAVDRVVREFGGLDILVNNAGISTVGMAFGDIDDGAWDRIVGINLTGVYNGISAALPELRRSRGHIVNSASIGGLIAGPLMSAYSATKFAVVGLSEALRAELEPEGVGVTVLCPGPVRTRLWQTSRRARGLPDAPLPADGVGALSSAGMDPDVVGELVVTAIRDNRQYVITHPDYRDAVQARHAILMEDFELEGSDRP